MANQLYTKIKKQLKQSIDRSEIAKDGLLTLTIKPEYIVVVCQALRDEFQFEQLTDLAGVDYSAYGQHDWETHAATSKGFSRGVANEYPPLKTDAANRFAVVYHVLSYAQNCRLCLKTFLNTEMPRVASVVDVWPVADWYEREAFDLLGIVFDGHPDLRRILTDYGFVGHPFRKDFPLSGEVEMRYDEHKQRVVYEPVDIKPRVLVPRVIRDDDRYEGAKS